MVISPSASAVTVGARGGENGGTRQAAGPAADAAAAEARSELATGRCSSMYDLMSSLSRTLLGIVCVEEQVKSNDSKIA
jgi:hypothetical protein